jgi:hypothetical protein
MPEEKKYTDQDFYKIIDMAVTKAVEQVKPVDCNLHADILASILSHNTDLQDDIDGLAKMLGEAINGGKERSNDIKGIYDALFVSDGDKRVCISEKMRVVEKKIDDHVLNHKEVVSSWRFWIPVALTCASSVVIALWALFATINDPKINKQQITEIVLTVIKEAKKP